MDALKNNEPKWVGKAIATLENVEPSQVWSLLADFCSLNRWFPTLATCVLAEGVNGEPGCVRYCAGFKTHLTHPEDPDHFNWTKQKLLSIDPRNMSLCYSIIDGNVGFESYVSRVRVLAREGEGGGGCAIEWEYEVKPVEGWRFEDLERFIGEGLKVMAARMEHALTNAAGKL